MATIHEQVLAGTAVPDYANNRFVACEAPPAAPDPVPAAISVPAPKRKIADIPSLAPAVAIDMLVADTLEKHLQPIRVTSLLDHTTRAAIVFALTRSKGNQSRAAAILGINRMSLRKKCSRYQLDPVLFGGRPGNQKAA